MPPSLFKEEKMCEKKQTLSASNIRYLIALNALDSEDGIRCIDIAEELSLTKPSVHRMMETFCDRSLVKKAKYGMVFLTEEGREFAERYAAYYDIVCRFFCRKLALPPDDAKSAACALLAGVSGEGLDNMCEKMRNVS